MSGLVPPIDFPQLHGKPGTPGPPGATGAQGPQGTAGTNGNALSVSVSVVDVMAMTVNNGKDIVAAVPGKIIVPLQAILCTIGVVGTNTGAPQISLRYTGSNSTITTDMQTGAGSTGTLTTGARGASGTQPSTAVGSALRACQSSSPLNGTWTGTSKLTVWYELADAT